MSIKSKNSTLANQELTKTRLNLSKWPQLKTPHLSKTLRLITLSLPIETVAFQGANLLRYKAWLLKCAKTSNISHASSSTIARKMIKWMRNQMKKAKIKTAKYSKTRTSVTKKCLKLVSNKLKLMWHLKNPRSIPRIRPTKSTTMRIEHWLNESSIRNKRMMPRVMRLETTIKFPAGIHAQIMMVINQGHKV